MVPLAGDLTFKKRQCAQFEGMAYWLIYQVYKVLAKGTVNGSTAKILQSDHSTGSYWAALSSVSYAAQGGSVTLSLWIKSQSIIQMKASEQYFFMVLLIMLYKAGLTFESVDTTLYVVILHLFSIVRAEEDAGTFQWTERGCVTLF